MSATPPPLDSPPPNSPVAATPPSSSVSPPPSSNSPPPDPPSAPPTQLNSPPPTATPPPQSPPPVTVSPPPSSNSPPPDRPSTPPTQLNSPPPTATPPPQSPPPVTVESPIPMAAPPPTPPIAKANAPPPTPPIANAPPPTPPIANAPPPQSNSPPPTPPIVNAPPPQPNAPPPTPPIVNTPPPQPNSPPPIVNAPPPQPNSPPPTPPIVNAPPPRPNAPPPAPPIVNTPPPKPNAPPPLPSSPPPVSPPPPTNSQPPPTSSVPPSSPPPPVANPRPPPPRPPNNAPPPPTATPPRNSPPPRRPPSNSSPPPPPPNPRGSSPPPPTKTPESPPPPGAPPPRPATPSVPSSSPPSSNSPPILPPPPSTVPSTPSLDPPGTTNTNSSSDNAPQVSQSPSGGGISTGATVGIAVALSLLLLGVFVAACFICKRKKKSSKHNVGHIMPTSISSSPRSASTPSNRSGSNNGGLGNSRSWFSYDELAEATDGFSDEKKLGEGGFGSVYKGNLADGREVAIKLLKSGGGQGEREFRSEADIISRVHHRHLVSLVGYCISGERRLLVFDYLPNNTLYFHLHGEGQPVIDWATRVKIAVGAARGISYLHEDCHPRIIHRDIKSSNILLDSNFEARVSDFGLAKLAMDANTHISTRVMGTFGYMAPEYASSGKLTEKSDVYSFGVVLLELATGRKPVDTSQPLGDESLVEWARPLLSDALETQQFEVLADPRLDGNFVDVEMFLLIEAAAACVRHSAAKRPTMGQVVRAFESLANSSDLNNGMKVGESEIFNSAQQSAEIRLFQRMAFGSHDFSTEFFSSRGSEGNCESSRRM